jgi:hypothetical protein
MSFNPLANLLPQLAADLLATFVTEKIDNPYLKQTLGTLTNCFTQGILSGLTPGQMAENATRQIDPRLLGSLSESEVQQQIEKLYTQTIQNGSAPVE